MDADDRPDLDGGAHPAVEFPKPQVAVLDMTELPGREFQNLEYSSPQRWPKLV